MTRAGHLWILALALLPIAGAPLLALPAYRRFSLPCRAVLSAGVGAVVLSVSMTFLSLLGWRWAVWNLAVTAGAILLGLRALAGGSPTGPIHRPAPSGNGRFIRRVSWAIVLVAAASSFVAAATSAATSADLVLHWATKGQQFAAARTLDVAFLRNPFLSYINVSYPPLVPNVYALAGMVAGRFSWAGATLTFPILLLAMAIALPSAVEADPAPRASLPAAALLAATLASAGPILQVAGNGDMALLFFEVLSLALLVGPARFEPAIQSLAGVLIAGAATSKVEGLVFAAAAVARFLVVNRRSLRWAPASARLGGPAAVALGLWFVFGLRFRLFHFYQGFGPLLEIHWDRLGPVLAAMARSLFAVDLGLPFLLPLAVLLVVRPRFAGGWIPAAVAIGSVLFLVFTYLHGGADPTEWIGWTASRVLLCVPALFIVSSASRQAEAEGSPAFESQTREGTRPPSP